MIRQSQFFLKDALSLEMVLNTIVHDPNYASSRSVLVKFYSSRVHYDEVVIMHEKIRKMLSRAQFMGVSVNNREFFFKDNIAVLVVQYFEKTDVRVLEFDVSANDMVYLDKAIVEQIDTIPDIKAVEGVSSFKHHDFYEALPIFDPKRADLLIFGMEAGFIVNEDDVTQVSSPAGSNTDDSKKSFGQLLLDSVFYVTEETNDRYVIGNKRTYRNGLVLVAYASPELKVHAEYFLGWKPIGKELEITKMKNEEWVETINDMPAAEIYQKYLNVALDKSFLRNVCEFPLVTMRNGFPIARFPPCFDEDKSLLFVADVHAGEKYKLAYANHQDLIDEAKEHALLMHSFMPEIMNLIICPNHVLFLGELYTEEFKPFVKFDSEVIPLFGNSEVLCYQHQGGVLNSYVIAVGMRESELDDNVCPLPVVDKKVSALLGEHDIYNAIPLYQRLAQFLKTTTEELSQALVSAEQASEAKSTFLSSMSHEIRTPINAILGMNELILRESTEPSVREYARNIEQAGDTLLNLVNSILDFSKIEAGKFNLIDGEYLEESILSELYALIDLRAKKQGLKFIIDVDKGIPAVLLGDELRIKQILTNLLTNAVKYTKEGSVTLKVKEVERSEHEVILRYTVTDTGIGIKEEDLPKLTKAFERIEESRNRTIEGTGLGMTITTKLLDMMGSRLEVSSVYGEGSTFSFNLTQKVISFEPLGVFHDKNSSLKSVNVLTRTFCAPDANILVVDDTIMNLKVILGLLKRTRMHIDTAQSGAECLNLVKEHDYHLILLDHRMPGMDGVETLHALLKLDKYQKKPIPVIALTANAITGSREYYLGEGFNDYLSKPVDPNLLEQTIQKFLPPSLIKTEDCAQSSESQKLSLPEWLLEQDVIDAKKGLANCGGVDNYFETLKIFYDSIESSARELSDFVEKGDIKNFTIKVHALKSSARIIGASTLSEKALRLESAGNSGYDNEIRENFPKLREDYLALLKILSPLSDDKNKEQENLEVNAEPIASDDLNEALGALSDAVLGYDIETVQMIMATLKEYALPENIDRMQKSLDEAVGKLDWDRMQQVIKEVSHA